MKKLTLTLLLPAMLLAYQPADPPPVALATLQPQPVFWPVIIGGVVVVGGAGFLGIKLINKILQIHEHRITNGAPDEVRFTWAEDEYPE